MKKTILAAIVLAAAPALADAQVCTQHTFLGNRPDEGNPGWHQEAQGLAHDADNWYVSQNPGFFVVGGTIQGGPKLWRIPVTHDLADGVDCGDTGVSCKRLFDTPLFGLGYNHYGDIDFFQTGGRSFLVVPIEGGDPGPAMAFFRGDETLEFLGLAPVAPQGKSSWVAVDPVGDVISSDVISPGSSIADHFNRFHVDWAALPEHMPADPMVPVLTLLDAPLLPRDDSGPLQFEHAQGGEFSDDGQLFYFANGFIGDAGPSWGLHVFRNRPGTAAECAPSPTCTIARRVERSHNGSGGFAFEFDSDCDDLDPTDNCEEAEGLTFWDLDADPRAPNVGGQLHAILLDNDFFTDDVYVKHYRLAQEDPDAPAITCPADANAECAVTGGVGAGDPQLAAFFGGVSASDACDEQVTIANDAPALFLLGNTPVNFTATDDALNASSCLARVIVVDTTPPGIACPAPAAVECTGAGGISAADPQLAAFFAGVSTSDACDASVSLSNDAPAFLPLGVTPVTFTAVDDSTNAATCSSPVTVADTVAPQISVTLSVDMLWPPNHRLVPVTATVAVTDRCDPAVSFQLVSIASNEPDDGLGDGDTTGDIQDAAVGTPDTTFLLRAERSGGGGGRIYTVVYRATDGSGNSSLAAAFVRVPHNP
jgi:HYR domain